MTCSKASLSACFCLTPGAGAAMQAWQHALLRLHPCTARGAFCTGMGLTCWLLDLWVNVSGERVGCLGCLPYRDLHILILISAFTWQSMMQALCSARTLWRQARQLQQPALGLPPCPALEAPALAPQPA